MMMELQQIILKLPHLIMFSDMVMVLDEIYAKLSSKGIIPMDK